MAKTVDKPVLFLSYSQRDENWRDRLLAHLKVLERNDILHIWDMSNLTPGANWAQEIESTIKQADIAVLLVSADYLASDYIINQELPALLSRREQEGLVILPIVVRPSFWASVPGLAQLQFLNTDAKPLAKLSESEVDSMLAHIARRIAEISGAIRERAASKKKRKRGKPASSSTVAKNDGVEFFISHSHVDGDFAELLKLKMEKAGYTAWIDIDRLKPGMGWQQAIDTAIEEATAVIAVMSPEGRSSEYVTYEWAYAWGNRVKIIPIMIRQTSLHPKLATLQYLDFTNRASRQWVELFDVLEALIATDVTISEPEIEAEA